MGRGRRDKVNLTGEQRENLEQISRNGYAPAKKILHARILLIGEKFVVLSVIRVCKKTRT